MAARQAIQSPISLGWLTSNMNLLYLILCYLLPALSADTSVDQLTTLDQKAQETVKLELRTINQTIVAIDAPFLAVSLERSMEYKQ